MPCASKRLRRLPGSRRGSPSSLSHAFTLVELLVVMAIISVLAGFLLPLLQTARQAARTVACMSNLKQAGVWAVDYAGSWGAMLPQTLTGMGENYWYRRDCPLYRPRAVRGTALHCPQAATGLAPRWIYVARCDFDYSQNQYYQGGGNGLYRPIVVKARHLSSKAFWMGDGMASLTGSKTTYVWPTMSAIYPPATPDTTQFYPWMWRHSDGSGAVSENRWLGMRPGHPRETANFLFGDMHAAARTFLEIWTISRANGPDVKKWIGRQQ